MVANNTSSFFLFQRQSHTLLGSTLQQAVEHPKHTQEK